MQDNVNLSVAGLKFPAGEKSLELQKSDRGLGSAIRCQFDRYAVNQSRLNGESLNIRSDKGPKLSGSQGKP